MRSQAEAPLSPVRRILAVQFLFAVVLLLQWVLVPAAALAQETEPDETTGVKLVDLTPGNAMVLVILGSIGVGAVWFIPMLYDMRKSYKRQVVAWESLATKYLEQAGNEPSLAELRLLLPQISKPPRGVPGLTRSLFAFTVLTVIAVSQLGLTFFNIEGAADLRKTIVTSLLSVFASITGFYFGQRGSQHEDEVQPLPDPKLGPPPPPAPASPPKSP
jgi:hypothetical protein